MMVNGVKVAAKETETLLEFLRIRHITPLTPGIAVAVNNTVIAKKNWSKKILRDGDTLEIVKPFQGG